MLEIRKYTRSEYDAAVTIKGTQFEIDMLLEFIAKPPLSVKAAKGITYIHKEPKK